MPPAAPKGIFDFPMIQDSILRQQRTFPAICWTLPKHARQVLKPNPLHARHSPVTLKHWLLNHDAADAFAVIPFLSEEILGMEGLGLGRFFHFTSPPKMQYLRSLAMMFRGGFKLPKAQGLRQKGERDCSVSVFAALTGMSEDELLVELPTAYLGKITVDEWCAWLESKGFKVLKRDGCPSDIVPSAHLVANVILDVTEGKNDAHWVFRDEDGDVHDPSQGSQFFAADDPRMRELSLYSMKVLTLSVSL